MELKRLLKSYKQGKITLNKILHYLSTLPYQKLNSSILDIHREVRRGVPEIVFCENKTPQQVVEVLNTLSKKHNIAIGTRLSKEKYEQIKKNIVANHKYFEKARIIFLGRKKKNKVGNILVISAGTSDIPIAEEAAVICELLGNKVTRVYDIGVAGLHRILEVIPYIRKANVIIVVAGMDGALPSVIGGIAKCPVIAVPTSVGYGANFKGLSALLTMLNSCASGVLVVNIDNGFGAGYAASIINKQSK